MFTQTETPVMPPAVDAALRLIQVLSGKYHAQETEPTCMESRAYTKACEAVLSYLTDYAEADAQAE